MEKIFGLPAHPLFVHAPVVLMPLALVLTIALAARPQWRRQAGWTLVLASGAVFVTSFAAKLSGEEFDQALDRDFVVDRSTHEGLANTTIIFVLIFFVTALVLWAMDRWGERQEEAPTWMGTTTAVFTTIVVVAAVLATVWMIRTGHEGAKLTHLDRI